MSDPLPDPQSIPAMSGNGIGDYLRDAAAKVKAPQAIVEIRPWLGANTAQMGAGTVAAGTETVPRAAGFDRAVPQLV